MVKLFVGNLSWNVTAEMLKAFFAENGVELADEDSMPELNNGRKESVVFIVPDKERRKPSKGFGFVAVANQAAADKATAELNGKELDGREIRIDLAN